MHDQLKSLGPCITSDSFLTPRESSPGWNSYLTDFGKNTWKLRGNNIIKFLIQEGVAVVVVIHVFNPSTREAEAGRSVSSKPDWATE